MWGRPRKRVVRNRVSTGAAIPAPIGGWDAQSPVANMPRENAVILDNWIPRPGYVEVRKGYRRWSSLAVPTESLLVWRGDPTRDDGVFACAGGSIYDVTLRDQAAVEVYSGALSNRWQSINFANDADAWLVACNGVNTPIAYSSGGLINLSITGSAGVITLIPDTLIDVMAHKGRLFFAEKESLRVWFLTPQAIQGQAFLLDLGPVFTSGGEIICMATWTLDGGAGPDDLAVFVTDQGQVAIYQGLDPSDANEWALVGVYDIGLPLSRRSLVKYGADLVLLTTDGVVPLSQALQLDRAQENLVALTQKIQDAFKIATRKYERNFGWEGMLYPKGSLAIFNVPAAELSRSEQFVQNIQTGAWCRFTNINAICWATANDAPFFGAANGVFVWDEGTLDDGQPLVADLKTAFSYFGSRGVQKKFEMLQPVMRISSTIAPAVEVLTDFREGVPTAIPTPLTYNGALWGQAIWSESEWSPSFEVRDSWTGVTGIGYCGAVRMRVRIDPLAGTLLGVGDDEESIVSENGDVMIAIDRGAEPAGLVEVVAFNLKYQNQTGGQL